MASFGPGVAWVTGASSGIGRALAQRLARDGWTVLASARRSEALDELAKATKDAAGALVPIPLDITDASAAAGAVREIIDRFGRIDLAVLNAGTHRPMSALSLDVAAVDDLMRVNFMGTVNCLVPVLDRMREAGRGHIAIVSSVSGYCGLPTAAAYGASKAALINMAESLKPELDSVRVKLQIVNPGFVETPLTDRNTFEMPFLIPVEAAVDAFVKGLAGNSFEIRFPTRMGLAMSVLRALPYSLFFRVTRRLVPERPQTR